MDIHTKGLNKKLFGKKLNRARKQKGVSSDQLSEQIGKSSGGYIRMIESAQTGVSLDALADICNALKISPEYLLSDSLCFESELLEKIKLLSPTQYNSIVKMVDAMIDENDEE